MTAPITLNVGGVPFCTSRQTLEALGGAHFFGGLVRALGDGTESTALFIDRDPTHFRHVLNHLRGSTTAPATADGIEQLIAEADFYALELLKKELEDRLRAVRTDEIARQLGIIAAKLG